MTKEFSNKKHCPASLDFSKIYSKIGLGRRKAPSLPTAPNKKNRREELSKDFI